MALLKPPPDPLPAESEFAPDDKATAAAERREAAGRRRRWMAPPPPPRTRTSRWTSRMTAEVDEGCYCCCSSRICEVDRVAGAPPPPLERRKSVGAIGRGVILCPKAVPPPDSKPSSTCGRRLLDRRRNARLRSRVAVRHASQATTAPPLATPKKARGTAPGGLVCERMTATPLVHQIATA